ncbi:MAG: hypothetical protein ACYTG4_09985 [Planctomycetota bacterium]
MQATLRLRMVASPFIIVLAALAGGCASTDVGPALDMAGEEQSAAAFERIRGLAGSWSPVDPDSDMAMKVVYRETAAGNTVEEVLNPGAPHEMVTMYHRDGPLLLLTHYCAAGNQPTMVLLASSDPDILRFDFLRGTNMTPTDGHMHRAVIDLSRENRVTGTWTFFVDGAAGNDIVVQTQRSE